MNPLNLPPRLQTALSFADSAVLADIGCDHAYLPISACLKGITKRAIACDVNPGPLARAAENIRAYHLQDRIDLRLGSGMTPLAPGEADCVVMAGMGGMNMVEIIYESMDAAKSVKKLILQPQHDLHRLRMFLHASFFSIYDEVLIRESGRYYTVIAARPCAKRESWSELEYFYGKIIIEKGGEAAASFFKLEKEKLEKYASREASPSLNIRKEFLSGL